MAKSATLAIKDGQVRGSLNALLRDLLDKQVVEAVLVPIAHPAGNNVIQSLVTNPETLEHADVFAPVMPVNAARIVQAMTRLTPANKKTALVMRPCELRALVELVKLRQASLENLYLIGIDCPGAYAVSDYPGFAAESTSAAFLKAAWNGQDDPRLRAGCSVCEYPVPLFTDLTIGVVGLDADKELLLLAGTEKGEEILEGLGLETAADSEAESKRAAAAEALLEKMRGIREKFFEQTKEEISGADTLSVIFGPCIKCQNCRINCPVCYCRECFFDSPTFELEAEKYLATAEKRGVVRMPADTLLFHLTRMTHMAHSCIGCGACEEVCPSDIPLLKIFQLTGTNVQKLFDYVPGRSIDDELPPTAFKEDELEWIGEK
jgi:formate dehydrogenase subunit beta